MAPALASFMVRKMSRWINVVLVYVLLGAVLLIITRALLPIIRLSGMAGELYQPLANLTPILLAISLTAITLITFNLRRQTKLAKKLSEEAEILGAESIIGDVESSNINITAAANPSLNNGLKPESLPERSKNHQADDRNGSSNGRSSWHSPTFTTAPEGESLGVAVAAAGAATDKARGENRQAAPPTVRDLSLALSEDRASKRSENKNKV